MKSALCAFVLIGAMWQPALEAEPNQIKSKPTNSHKPTVTPEPARELDFAGFTAATTRSNATGLGACAIPSLCDLDRTTIGDMSIGRANVSFDKARGKIQLVTFNADTLFEKTAIAQFIAKYGKPTSDAVKMELNRTGGPYETRTVEWKNFTNGNSAFIYRSEDRLLIMIRWAENIDTTPKKPKVDF